MAYDPVRLNKEVRIYIGGISEEQLPENIISFWADFWDENPKYTSKYEYILWKTTLSSLDYLKANKASSTSSAAKSTRKEKVGDVELTITEDSSSASATAVSYQDLYDDYLNSPEKFGIDVTTASGSSSSGGLVLIGGVNQQEVDDYRANPETTGIYSPLSVTAFPKDDPNPYRRQRNKQVVRRRGY